MTENEILQVYMHLSENVRALGKVKDGIIKDINYQIRKQDEFQISIKTKLLAFLYSAWSEAQFLQIAYTPNAFYFTEIQKIKAVKELRGIGVGWNYMLETAIQKVGDVKNNSDLKSRLATLLQLVQNYVKEPSTIRNKLAHGQWVVALNGENTRKNEELTTEILQLDSVKIEKQFQVHLYLGFIVRDLVQSPKAGFHTHYWTNIVNLEKYLKKTQGWNTQTKRNKLIVKPIKPKAPEAKSTTDSAEIRSAL